MGDKATLRMAQQELEDLYLGVPDDSVDLTFKDFASASSAPPTTAKAKPAAGSTTSSGLPPPPLATVLEDAAAEDDSDAGRRNSTKDKAGLARSSTNIFTYRPLEDREGDNMDHDGLSGVILQLSSPPPPPAAAATTTTSTSATRGADRGPRRHVVVDHRDNNNNNMNRNCKRPGIPHSNVCTLCNQHVYLFRHRCLVCGRVYCRRCVGAGMGEMTEGRKCVDCLGRRYSHRYIHRAGDTGAGCCCLYFWGYYPSAKAVTAQELVWAEKGPAPRRRPRQYGPSSVSTSYGSVGYFNSTNTVASASMSCDTMSAVMNGHSIGGVPASASSSFVASHAPNPHAFPL